MPLQKIQIGKTYVTLPDPYGMGGGILFTVTSRQLRAKKVLGRTFGFRDVLTPTGPNAWGEQFILGFSRDLEPSLNPGDAVKISNHNPCDEHILGDTTPGYRSLTQTGRNNVIKVQRDAHGTYVATHNVNQKRFIEVKLSKGTVFVESFYVYLPDDYVVPHKPV